jgi:hypothetical protein
MIEISRDFDGCSGTRKEELFDAGCESNIPTRKN